MKKMKTLVLKAECQLHHNKNGRPLKMKRQVIQWKKPILAKHISDKDQDQEHIKNFQNTVVQKSKAYF